jgi:tetratricopeptide (TPR) repeat protein
MSLGEAAALQVLEILDRPMLFRFGRSSRYGWRRHAAMSAARPLGPSALSDELAGRLLRLRGAPEALAILEKAGGSADPAARAFLWEASAAAGARADLRGIDFAVRAQPDEPWWKLWRAAGRLARHREPAYVMEASGVRRAANESSMQAARLAREDADGALELDPGIALGWALAARASADQGLDGEALRAADQTVRLEPRQSWPLQARAALRLSVGDREGFLSDLDGALRLSEGIEAFGSSGRGRSTLADEVRWTTDMLRRRPKEQWLYVLRGNCRRSPQLNDFSGALADLEKAVELKPDCSWAWAYFSRALSTGGRAPEALEAMDRAIRLDPACGWIRVWKGELLRRRGAPDKAISEFDRGLELDPDYDFGYAWRGGAWRAVGEPARALPDLELAARLDPGYAWTRHELSLALSELGRTERALDEAEQAYRLDPKFAWCAEGEDVPRALAQLEEDRRRRPGDARPHAWSGALKLRLGRPGEALVDLRQAMRLDPGHARVRMWLGQALSALGRPEAALAALDGAVRADPSCAEALAWRGRLAFESGRHAGGRRDLSRAAKLEPRAAWIQEWMGRAQLAAGLPADAVRSFSAALQLDARSRSARSGRAEARRMLGRRKEGS